MLLDSVCVFCFKQKTAYELRISEWSSDVCSSDLVRRRRAPAGVARSRASRAPRTGTWGSSPARSAHTRAPRRGRIRTPRARERKSVVEGKRVSGRVDRGGRRIINKQTNKQTHYIQYIYTTTTHLHTKRPDH